MEGSSGEGTSYDLVEAQDRAWLEDAPCQVRDSQDLPQALWPRPAEGKSEMELEHECSLSRYAQVEGRKVCQGPTLRLHLSQALCRLCSLC